jgi:tetratricopeptide (TPR) repeat protein
MVQADTNNAAITTDVSALQHEWATIKYKITDKKQQINKLGQLLLKAENAAKTSPNSAEVKIWQAIILSTQAGIKGGLGALGKVKKARNLLLEAQKLNPNALNGSAYTSLGTLYYQVPGWPIGFGNKGKAKAYLTKALALNPQGIDPNFFYGDFLVEQGKYKQAITVLNTALAAPARASRPIADAGRRNEIVALLKKIKIAQEED